MPLVRVKEKYQLTLPSELRAQARLSVGDYLDAKISPAGVITLTPKNYVDYQIAQGLADLKAGRTYGPFDNAASLAKSVESNLKRRRGTKSLKRAR